MTFKKNNYIIVKNAVPKIVAYVAYHYLLLKREVYLKHIEHGKTIEHFGVMGDPVAGNTYCHYSDILMETLLLEMLPTMQKKTKLDLIPTYSYCRIYKNGDTLRRHKDRPSCAVSTTIKLGGDSWPIFLEPSGLKGKKGKKIKLETGDMLIYDGEKLEHWREEFKGQECAQVFLHYTEKKNKDLLFDTRPIAGLPINFRGKINGNK
jgi:hypothetical protein